MQKDDKTDFEEQMLLKDDENGLTKKKNKNNNQVFTISIVVVALAILGISLFQIISYLWEGKVQEDFNQSLIEEGITPITVTEGSSNAENQTDETTTGESNTSEGPQEQEKPNPILKTPDIAVDFEKLSAKYPGIVGWLYMPGGGMNNPVMQAKNNDYYLYRLPNGKKNASGSLFLDYRDSSAMTGWNHLIYGHNMKNGAMFGILHDYRTEGYYESHPYMFYFTPTQTYRVEIFAAVHSLATSFIYTRPASQTARQNYLNEALSRSVFTSNVSVTPEDSILVLSTCSGASEGDDRFVVMGKLVPLS